MGASLPHGGTGAYIYKYPPPGGGEYKPMSFGGKNMKRRREKGGKYKRKRKKRGKKKGRKGKENEKRGSKRVKYREELRQKSQDGRRKTMCRERGKMIIFRRGNKYHFRTEI
jgi:hypothetical protein